MRKNKKNIKGFTLLEILIVTFIISLGLVGVFSLFLQTIKVQNVNKNELTASMLAQEGIELVRNMRDSNWILGIPYNNGLVGYYALDYTGAKTNLLSIDEPGANLKVDTGTYTLTGSESSVFNRIVNTVDNSDSLNVECIVQWDERGAKKQYKVQTVLYDWQ